MSEDKAVDTPTRKRPGHTPSSELRGVNGVVDVDDIEKSPPPADTTNDPKVDPACTKRTCPDKGESNAPSTNEPEPSTNGPASTTNGTPRASAMQSGNLMLCVSFSLLQVVVQSNAVVKE